MDEQIKRAVYLLEVVQGFFNDNPMAAEMPAYYDDSGCDGACLGEDCATAAAELVRAHQLMLDAEAMVAKGLGYYDSP